MRRITIFILGMLFLTGVAAAAQGVLPASFGGWTGVVQARIEPAGTEPQKLAALREYGLVAGENGTYKNGTESLQVDTYQMKDPSGAYGLLTYLRPADMPHANASLGKHAFLSENEALMLAGNVVVDVHGRNLRRNEGDLKALLQQVSAHAQMGALPTLWQELPAKQIVVGSDKYVLGPQTLNQLFPVALGDAVGFSKGAEAEVARYRSRQGQATLLLIDLPTPQIATETLNQLAGKFDVNGSKAGMGKSLYAKRLITTLAIVAAPNDAEGHALLAEVQSGEVLTWNQPTPKGKQADIGTIVVGTIVGTGAICAFSLIAGLAFAGLRLTVKRVLPGKIFDRAKHMQVIQMGLSSKPINSDDFYDRSGPAVKLGKLEKNLPEKTALRLFR
jgi:Family of unknown function (DUF6599)